MYNLQDTSGTCTQLVMVILKEIGKTFLTGGTGTLLCVRLQIEDKMDLYRLAT